MTGELWADPNGYPHAIGALPVAGWDAFRNWTVSIGELSRAITRSVVGETTLDGTLARMRQTVLSAALDAAGVIARAMQTSRDGVLTVSGALATIATRVLTFLGTLFVEAGALPETIAALPIAGWDAVRGWATSVGQLTRVTQRAVAATVQPQRTLARLVGITATAALSLSATASAALVRVLTAAVLCVGVVALTSVAALVATLGVAGAVAGRLSANATVQGVLTLTGAAGRRFAQGVAGLVGFVRTVVWSRLQRTLRFVRLGLRDIAQWRP